jgi:hypothetical protein
LNPVLTHTQCIYNRFCCVACVSVYAEFAHVVFAIQFTITIVCAISHPVHAWRMSSFLPSSCNQSNNSNRRGQITKLSILCLHFSHSTSSSSLSRILSHDWAIVDGVWTGDRICWTLWYTQLLTTTAATAHKLVSTVLLFDSSNCCPKTD